jgi:hypothetical protein
MHDHAVGAQPLVLLQEVIQEPGIVQHLQDRLSAAKQRGSEMTPGCGWHCTGSTQF